MSLKLIAALELADGTGGSAGRVPPARSYPAVGGLTSDAGGRGEGLVRRYPSPLCRPAVYIVYFCAGA